MTDESTPPTPPTPPTSTTPTWKLPDGIEDYIEEGLIKTAAGAVIGGVVGAVMFKSGGGWRSASVAMGVGTGIGSTIQRAVADPNLK